MKVMRTVPLLLLLALAGCKESTDMLLAAHAKPVNGDAGLQAQYHYSGADIPASASRDEVYEYH